MKNIIRVVFGLLVLTAAVQLQTFQVIPPLGGGQPRNTMIFIHGMTGNGQAFVPYFSNPYTTPVGMTTKVILPTAASKPVTVWGGAKVNSWFDILDGEFGPNSYSYEEMAVSVAWFVDIIENEVKQYGGDYSHILIGGHSQGCIMSLQIALGFKSQLGGIICFCGAMSYKTELKQPETPALIMHGTADPTLPVEKAQASYQRLKGLPNKEFVPFYGQDHSISPEMAALFKPFFEKYAKK